MRSPTIVLTIVVLFLVFASGCSSKTNVRYITGDVISRPSPSEMNAPQNTQPTSGPVEIMDDVRVRKESEVVATVTTSQEEITSSIQCDREKVDLGYKACHNTTNGMVKVILRNVGYDYITGLLFNINVDGKPNYESTDKGIGVMEYVEYILDLPRWNRKYGSTDRIIIIPLTKTAEGEKACPNVALLLEPQSSCTKYL